MFRWLRVQSNQMWLCVSGWVLPQGVHRLPTVLGVLRVFRRLRVQPNQMWLCVSGWVLPQGVHRLPTVLGVLRVFRWIRIQPNQMWLCVSRWVLSKEYIDFLQSWVYSECSDGYVFSQIKCGCVLAGECYQRST